MASQTRGSIEEYSVTFSNETEKTITFQAASIQNKNFPSAPYVKVISAFTAETNVLYAEKNLLYDSDGGFVPTYTHSGTQTNEVAATTNALLPTEYRVLNNAKNIVSKARKIPYAGFLTVPFNNSYTKNTSVVQLFFQAKATETFESGDDFRIYFVNATQIDANNDSTPSSASQTEQLGYEVYVNKNQVWTKIKSDVFDGQYYADIQEDDVIAALGSNALGTGYVWFRVDVKNTADGTVREDIKALKGFSFYNLFAADHNLLISDVSVVIWNDEQATLNWQDLKSTGANETYDDFFTPTTTNNFVPYLHTPSNIGVTFTDVTPTGMKIITSAPFIGVIRYLCSVQG